MPSATKAARRTLRLIHTLSLVIVSLVALQCGIQLDDSNYYGHPKNYGILSNSDDDGTRNRKNPPAGNGEDNQTPADDPAADPEEEEPAVEPGEPEPDEEEEPEEPTPIDPNTLVENTSYAAWFDQPSARRLVDGEAPSAIPSLAVRTVRSRLITQSGDGMITGFRYGDGQSLSPAYEDLTMAGFDSSLGPDEVSTSAHKSYTRVSGTQDCPPVFVCIDHKTVEPETGDAFTDCFYDQDTGLPRNFPKSAASSYRWTDVAPHLGAYGPFVIKRFPGTNVDCRNPPRTAELTETIMTTVLGVQNPPVTLVHHTVNPLTADYMLEFSNTRITGNNDRPYLDETVELQVRTRYFVNEQAAKFVQIAPTVRRSVDLGLAGIFITMDGVQVDMYLDMCRDLLNINSENHCGN
jgi:hypothetical protein